MISHISPISNTVEANEYVVIWEIVHQINLVEGSKDTIIWRWTADGEYTSKSAYQI